MTGSEKSENQILQEILSLSGFSFLFCTTKLSFTTASILTVEPALDGHHFIFFNSSVFNFFNTFCSNLPQENSWLKWCPCYQSMRHRGREYCLSFVWLANSGCCSGDPEYPGYRHKKRQTFSPCSSPSKGGEGWVTSPAESSGNRSPVDAAPGILWIVRKI